MAIVNFLAELWGFCLIIICLSLLVKPKHLKNFLALAENETALLMIGFFDILVGVASVLTYNTWDKSWMVVITIFGWLLIIKGVMYLFMPEMTIEWIKKWKTEYVKWFPTMMVVGVLIGCILVYLGMTF